MTELEITKIAFIVLSFATIGYLIKLINKDIT